MTPARPPEMPLADAERRRIGQWAAACAERALPLHAAAAPDDPRPREALVAIRSYGAGERRTAQLRTRALAALAAARDTTDLAASAAARAAGLAASSAYLHAHATLDQAKHILAPPAYAARAHQLAHPDDVGAASRELRWAIEHAPPEVGAVIRRMPARPAGRGWLDVLLHELDAGLRAGPREPPRATAPRGRTGRAR